MRARWVLLAVAAAEIFVGGSQPAAADGPPVGAASGAAHVRDTSAGWGVSIHLDPTNDLKAVSCASPTFCAAVDMSGRALVHDGETWSAPQVIDPGGELADVSCVSAPFCVATITGYGPDPGKVRTYDGTAWSKPQQLGRFLGPVSCTSRTFCLAINVSPSRVYTFDGTTWTRASSDPVPAADVSCVSDSMCVAVGDRLASTFDGVHWVTTKIVPHLPRFVRLDSVSCVSAAFCVAASTTGQAYTYDGSGWSKPTVVVPMRPRTGATSVSCGAVGACVMVTSHGQASVFSAGSWSTPERIDPVRHGYYASVSCSGPDFCTAVHDGYATVYRS